MNIEKKIFSGRLNSDINERLFSSEKFAGDYIDAYNVLIFNAIDSGVGLVKGFKGTTEIPFNYGYSSNSRKIIGREVDMQQKMIYFIIAHANVPTANDGIYRLNILTKEVELVLKGLFLNLDNTLRITGIDIVDGKYLLYTDGKNEPRNIDIQRAIDGEITEEIQIFAIKTPPSRAPKNIEISTDLNYLDNNIRGNFFQFKYRYVYIDDTKSVFSPISSISTMGALSLPEVEQAAPWYEGNQIIFDYEVEDYDIKAVEIAVRSGNTGDFGLIDTITDFSLGDNSYVFRNNSILLPIEARESNLLYDRIPLKALAQKVVNGSNVVYGGITRGFDIPDVNISATAYTESIVSVGVSASVVEANVISIFSNFNSGVIFSPITINFNDGTTSGNVTVPAGEYNADEIATYIFDYISSFYPTVIVRKRAIFINIYSRGNGSMSASSSHSGLDGISAIVNNNRNISYDINYTFNPVSTNILPTNTYISIVVSRGESNYTFYYRSSEPLSIGDFMNNFCEAISNNNIGVFAYKSLDSNYTIKVNSGTSIMSVFEGVSAAPLVSLNSVKEGDSYTYGIIYTGDGGRVSDTITNSDCQVDVPFVGSETSFPRVLVSVFSRPPVWAKEWHLCRTKRRKCGFFIQFGITTIGQSGSFLEINFNNDQSNLPFYNETYGSKLSYTFAEGDRLKFVRYKNGTRFQLNEDLPILGVREDGALKIPLPKSIELNFSALEGCVVEVYRPNTYSSIPDDLQLFYEVGLSGKVENAGESNRYHGIYSEDADSGQAQEQAPDLSFPLILTPKEGDVWYKTSRFINFTKNPDGTIASRTAGQETRFCSMYQSDKYPTETSSIGRLNAYNKDQKEVFEPATVYYSETYFTQSRTNDINRIYETSFRDYDQTYGAIKLFHLDGFLLYLYQENRVGRIPVLRKMVFNQDGSSSLILSSDLINECNYFDYAGGIGNNPESFCSNQFNQFFVDYTNNAVCKIGGNGIYRISDLSMVSHFTNVFNTYKNADLSKTAGQTPRFYMAWDEDNKLIFLCPETLTQFNGEQDPTYFSADTIVFRDIDGRDGWVTKVELEPSAIIGVFGELLSWSNLNGKIWEHNSNETRNLFYGEQKSKSITFAMASSASVNKSFLVISQEVEMISGDRYSGIYTGVDPSIWGVPEITTSLTQQSNLIASDFVKKEGMYYAKLLRDTTTPIDNPLINGDQLKGVWIKCKIENESSEDVGLYSVNIGSVVSRRSGY